MRYVIKYKTKEMYIGYRTFNYKKGSQILITDFDGARVFSNKAAATRSKNYWSKILHKSFELEEVELRKCI